MDDPLEDDTNDFIGPFEDEIVEHINENSNENLQAISGINHPIPCSDKKDDEMILIKAPLENSFGEDSLDNDGNIVYREWYETLEEHSHNEDYYHEHPDSENNDNE